MGGLGALAWLIASAWGDVVPFAAGFVLAYLTLPVIDRLDRVMPRALAAALVLILELLSVGLFFALLVPPVVGQVARLPFLLSDSLDPRVLAEQLRATI